MNERDPNRHPVPHYPDKRDRPKNPKHVQVQPGEWFHEGTVYKIADMPIDIIVSVAERRKAKGLFVHPKMAKRLKDANIEV